MVNVNVINDLAGGQSWFGSSGDDTYRDNIGGAQGVPDVDIQHDGPMSHTGNPWDNCADGASDILETSDGDNNDTMIGGREDFFIGDNGDTVVIVEPDPENGGVREVWRGTWSTYVTVQGLLRRGKDIVDFLSHNFAWSGDPFQARDFLVVAAHDLVTTAPKSGPVVLSQAYPFGPYIDGTPAPFANDFLEWLPYENASTILPTIENIVLTQDEFQEALLGALTFISLAYDDIQVPALTTGS
jgi:hypothetical protein